MSKIHVIAEAGTNHNGQLSKAIALAKIAKEVGADSVKYQLINTWGLYLPGKYEYGKYNIDDVLKIRQEGEFTDEEYKILNTECTQIGIPFTVSVFDKDGLNLAATFNPEYIKIASCDLNNLHFLRQVASKGIKMILSTGMSDMWEIEKTLNDLHKHGFTDIVLMHCLSEYPAFLEKMNLSFIDDLKTFGFPLGLSDHTGNSLAACMALTKGVTWFEKHFTEDKTQKGLDHAYAMEKEGLSQYINDLKAAEKALDIKEEKVGEGEKLTAQRARRSLYAARDIMVGETIKEEDILIVRPQGPLSADQYDDIINRPITIAIKKYQPFTLDTFN